MRQSGLAMIALTLALAACGSAIAAQPAAAPLLEDRSYDRVEEIRAGRLTTVVGPTARDGEFHRLAQSSIPWSRN